MAGRPAVPQGYRQLFSDILDEQQLKFDREGNRRTAYGLWHSYICLRLMEGADIYQIAKNCRTGVEMIEKFYASHIKTTSPITSASRGRARPRRRVRNRSWRQLMRYRTIADRRRQFYK